MIAHEGKDAAKGTKGSSDFEQLADMVLSGRGTPGGAEISVKFNRKGPDGYTVSFDAIRRSEPGRYHDVPVLVYHGQTQNDVTLKSSRVVPRSRLTGPRSTAASKRTACLADYGGQEGWPSDFLLAPKQDRSRATAKAARRIIGGIIKSDNGRFTA